MKKEIIELFFLGDEAFYEECLNKKLPYYLIEIQKRIQQKNPPYDKQKLFYINFLLFTLKTKFMENEANQIDLYLFFNSIYHSDRLHYSGLIEKHIKQLIAYFKNIEAPSIDLNAYKKTVAYPHLEDVYFSDNNTLHNKILDITTNFNLESVPTKEALEQKALGNTPFMLACKIGHSKAALSLLESSQKLGVDINQADERGMTPLHWACFYRDQALIQSLLDAGALPHLTNQDGDIPLNLYNNNLDPDASLLAGKKGFLPNTPSIAEGQLKYVINNQGEKKSAWIDIVFHMDKIALHKLGISANQLNQEVVAVESQLPEHTLETQPNVVFEIFTFYHFHNFIKVRNEIKPEMELVQKLLPQLAIKKELQKETNKNSSFANPQVEELKSNLINKIEDYLNWRNNKDQPDPRGYKKGFFTRLRHSTEFGENRANSLKEQLLEASTSAEIKKILINHFSKNSKLNNHSLDTYLLEACSDTNLFPFKGNLRSNAGRELYISKLILHLKDSTFELSPEQELPINANSSLQT